MKKVSIIVPVFKIPNNALIECIESLKSQTYKNIEVLLIDDGSPDNCGNICDEYSNKNDIIKTFHKQNGGVSTARNFGLDNATGDYILFVDADDVLHPEAVERLINIAIIDNADIVVCSYLRFFSQDISYEKCKCDDSYRTFEEENELVILQKKCLVEDNELGITFNGAPWGKLYKKEIIGDSKFDERLVRSQDNHFNFRVFKKVNKVSYTPSQLYLYRFLEESSVNRFRNNLFEISDKYIRAVESEISYKHEFFKDVFYLVRLEKLCEYYSTFIAHKCNKIDLSEKISLMKSAKQKWLNIDDIPLDNRKNIYSLIYCYLLKKEMFVSLYVLIRVKSVAKLFYKRFL